LYLLPEDYHLNKGRLVTYVLTYLLTYLSVHTYLHSGQFLVLSVFSRKGQGQTTICHTSSLLSYQH